MDMQKIGNFLKELRKERGLTQEQLAEELGVAGRTVSRWETASNMPDLSILIQIAEYYDVEVKEILDGERRNNTMDKDLKETLEKVADYNAIEKRNAVSIGNTAFGVAFLICAAAIIIQFLLFSSLSLVAGETIVLVAAGIVYITLMVHRGLWDAASKNKRTVLNDGVLSVVISVVFSVLYTIIIYPKTGSAVTVSRVCVVFFVGISILCFLLLRFLAIISSRKKDMHEHEADI